MFRFLILALLLAPVACSSEEESSSVGATGEPAAEVSGETLGPVADSAYDSPSDSGAVVEVPLALGEGQGGDVASALDAEVAAVGAEASAAEDDATAKRGTD